MERKSIRVRAGELIGNPVGDALFAGRLVATVKSKGTGTEVSIQFNCKRERRDEDEDKSRRRWLPCTFPEAERVYLDVPARDSSGNVTPGVEVGLWNTAGKFAGSMICPFGKDAFDPKHVWAALKIIDVAADRAPEETDDYIVLKGEYCLRCGAELTKVESIERGFGPHCWEKVHGVALPTEEEEAEVHVSDPPMERHAGAAIAAQDEARRGPPAERQMTIIEPGTLAGNASMEDHIHPWHENPKEPKPPGPDRDSYHDEKDPRKLNPCPRCSGDGFTRGAVICPVCKGSGVNPEPKA